MGVFAEISAYVIQTLASLYLLAVVLRFLFQLVKADFYNPISQFVVKVTNPLLIPLRRLIPGIFGIDIASVILALLIQWLTMQILAFLSGYSIINPISALMWSCIGLLSLVVNIFFWGLVIMVIASWIAPQSHNPALLLLRQLLEPVMAPFRRLIPTIGGLDISPIFAFIALNITVKIIMLMAEATHLRAAWVLGIF